MRQLMLLLLLAALTACQQHEGLEKQDVINTSPVVATVHGVAIYESDIDAEIANMPASMMQYIHQPETRSRVLHALIRRQAMSQKAKALDLDMNPVVKQRIHAAQQHILIEAAKSWQLSHMTPIEPNEIQSYYQQHMAEFKMPAQAHARHILVETERQAWNILKKLRRHRASFPKLAVKYSLDQSNKGRGGNLNWFSRGMMVKAFDDVVFGLKKHGLSKPVKTKYGWHVIELLGKRPARQQPLDEAHDEIISILQHQRLEQWYQQVESATDITILKAAYQQ